MWATTVLIATVTILISRSISDNRIPVLPPCFLRGIKAPPPPSSCVAWERGDNGERRHYIKTNETANQTNMQNRHLYFFFAQKNSVSSREWFRMYWPRLVFKYFGWDMIKNINEISIVSNKTMLIMWLKIFSLGHLAVVENCITGLDHLRDCVGSGSINCVFKWSWEPSFPFIVI